MASIASKGQRHRLILQWNILTHLSTTELQEQVIWTNKCSN